MNTSVLRSYLSSSSSTVNRMKQLVPTFVLVPSSSPLRPTLFRSSSFVPFVTKLESVSNLNSHQRRHPHHSSPVPCQPFRQLTHSNAIRTKPPKKRAKKGPKQPTSTTAKTTKQPTGPIETLTDLLKLKVTQNADRKLVTLIKESETGIISNDLAKLTTSHADETAYRFAMRALINMRRPDLVTDLWTVRIEHSKLPFNARFAAAAIRCILRDSKKRPEKAELCKVIFSSLTDEMNRLLADASDIDGEQLTNDLSAGSIVEEDGQGQGQDCAAQESNENVIDGEDEVEDEVKQLVSAYANLVSSFLSSMQQSESAKRIDEKYAYNSFRNFQVLSERFPRRAALPISQYNELMRALGKIKKLNSIFTVLDIMRIHEVKRSDETFEHLANAAVRQVQFIKGAVSMQTLPPNEKNIPEVAFIGRSNVGKSSLVNMVCNRRALAKVSSRPGKTQQFNYFLINELEQNSSFYMVDLPGVGFAKVPRHLQLDWIQFMRQYFQYRDSLNLVFHLVDGRHGALGDDIALMKEMALVRGTLKYVVVLTKMDKSGGSKSKSAVFQSTRDALINCGCGPDTPIVVTSASSKLGRDEMWRHLQSAILPQRSSSPRSDGKRINWT